MKRRFTIFAIFLILISLFVSCATLKPVEAEEEERGLEVPVCNKNHSKDHEIRDFQYYSICYRESYEQAEWSAYVLTTERLVKNTNRTDDFREDPEISTQSATLADYKGSGYDRGHLTPAADMAFSKEAMSETFYMSNMSPQAPYFNRGIWMYLESQVRKWGTRFGTVYVISGPVLDKPASSYNTIGENKVAVPEAYYKVVMVPRDEYYEAIAFVIPNEKCADTFWDYAQSVDYVEEITGLDFFPKIKDKIEIQMEKEFNLDFWK